MRILFSVLIWKIDCASCSIELFVLMTVVVAAAVVVLGQIFHDAVELGQASTAGNLMKAYSSYKWWNNLLETCILAYYVYVLQVFLVTFSVRPFSALNPALAISSSSSNSHGILFLANQQNPIAIISTAINVLSSQQ